MKNFLLLGLLCFLSIVTSGQVMTLNILNNLRTKNVAEVEEYLVKRNWQLSDVVVKTDTTSGVSTFTYPKIKDYSINLLSFVEGEWSNNQNRIFFETTHKSLYLPILNSLKSLHYDLIRTKTADKKIKKLYKNKDNAILITSQNLMDDLQEPIPYYVILISNRYDFERLMENREFR